MKKQPISSRAEMNEVTSALIVAITEEAMQDDAGIGVSIFTPDQAPDLIAEAEAGEPEAIARWDMIRSMVMDLTNAIAQGHPPGCIGCAEQIQDRNFALCFVKAAVEKPTAGLAFPICPDCTFADDCRDRVMAYLRNFWPRLTVETMH